ISSNKENTNNYQPQLLNSYTIAISFNKLIMDNKNSQFPEVVIIGGGFGGIQLAKRLKDKEVNITMLDRHNYHTFQPLLYQVATGGLEADSIAFPLRKVFQSQKNLKFRMADVSQIHPEENKVSTSIGEFRY